MDETLGERVESCNSFSYQPSNVVFNGSKNKQNVTL